MFQIVQIEEKISWNSFLKILTPPSDSTDWVQKIWLQMFQITGICKKVGRFLLLTFCIPPPALPIVGVQTNLVRNGIILQIARIGKKIGGQTF